MIKFNTSLKCICWSVFCLLVLPAIAWAADDKDFCPTFQEFLADGVGDHCLLCGLYQTLMDACAKVVVKSWDAFAKPLQGVVSLGASIYIAVYTIKNLGSFSQQDATAYLSNDKTGILPLMFKTGVIVALLNDSTILYEYLIAPVISTGIAISNNIGDPSGFSVDSGFTANNVQDLFNEVIKKVRDFNDNIYKIIAIGRELLCLAFLPDGIFSWEWALIPFGGTLYVFGWFILVGVSFYLLDVLFRLAVGCIVLPLATACGISKLTSSYTKKTWDLFVNVFFDFVMLGIVLNFSLEMILKSLEQGGPLVGLVDQDSAFTADDAAEIAEKLEVKTFTLTTVCCLVVFQLFLKVQNLADSISGTTGVGTTGQTLGATAAQGAKAAATKAVGAPLGFAKAAAQEAGSTVANSSAGKKVRAFPRKTKAAITGAAVRAGLRMRGWARNIFR